jgi:hypothetical protein
LIIKPVKPAGSCSGSPVFKTLGITNLQNTTLYPIMKRIKELKGNLIKFSFERIYTVLNVGVDSLSKEAHSLPPGFYRSEEEAGSQQETNFTSVHAS